MFRPITIRRHALLSHYLLSDFCGRRGHRDDDKTPSDNQGHFKELIKFRIEAGDTLLDEHLKQCNKNAKYTSKTSQNELLFCIKTTFPNITKKFNLLLLPSVTSSSTERASSSLKLIKNVMKSTMGEDRLNALLLLYVYRYINLDYDKIIDDYSRRNPRKMVLMNPVGDI